MLIVDTDGNRNSGRDGWLFWLHTTGAITIIISLLITILFDDIMEYVQLSKVKLLLKIFVEFVFCCTQLNL